MKQKKVVNIDDLLEINKKDIIKNKYKTSLSESIASDNDTNLINSLNLRTGNYSLKTKIIKNPWVNDRPASKAVKWLFNEVFKQPQEYRYTRRVLYQGGLFTFEYKNPKYKGTNILPWFDKYPLFLSLGPIVTNNGIRNIGFNLHLLPPKIRIVVICAIFKMYAKLYRYQVFFKQDKPVQIHYKQIINILEKYGVKFCVRMYIPSRMNQIVKFPIKTWYKAIFLPSRGYDSIKAEKLIREWKKFCRKNKFAGKENINWKSLL